MPQEKNPGKKKEPHEKDLSAEEAASHGAAPEEESTSADLPQPESDPSEPAGDGGAGDGGGAEHEEEEAATSANAPAEGEEAATQATGPAEGEEAETQPAAAEEESTSADLPQSEDPQALYVRELEQAVRELEQAILERDKRVDEVLSAYRSNQAETARIRERIERDREKRLMQEKVKLFGRLLEPLDNIERCFVAAGKSGADVDGLKDGLGMVHRQLQDVMFSLGLKRVDPTGQKFDPEKHEAVSVAPVEDADKVDVVIECVQPGYVLEDQLVRAARVVVGKKS